MRKWKIKRLDRVELYAVAIMFARRFEATPDGLPTGYEITLPNSGVSEDRPARIELLNGEESVRDHASWLELYLDGWLTGGDLLEIHRYPCHIG